MPISRRGGKIPRIHSLSLRMRRKSSYQLELSCLLFCVLMKGVVHLAPLPMPKPQTHHHHQLTTHLTTPLYLRRVLLCPLVLTRLLVLWPLSNPIPGPVSWHQ